VAGLRSVLLQERGEFTPALLQGVWEQLVTDLHVGGFQLDNDWLLHVEEQALRSAVWRARHAPISAAIPDNLVSYFNFEPTDLTEMGAAERQRLDLLKNQRCCCCRNSGAVQTLYESEVSVLFYSGLFENCFPEPLPAAAELSAFLLLAMPTQANGNRSGGQCFRGSSPLPVRKMWSRHPYCIVPTVSIQGRI